MSFRRFCSQNTDHKRSKNPIAKIFDVRNNLLRKHA